MKVWRSRAIALVAVGAVGALGCYSPEETSQPIEMRRHGYVSVEACRQDYPFAACAIEADFAGLSNCLAEKDRGVCEAESLASGAAYAWGPWHAVDPALAAPSDPGAGASAAHGVSQVAASTETAMRGGDGGAQTASGMGCTGGG